MLITDRELPGLYHAADKASAEGQRVYFVALMFYLLLLILAAVFSFFSGDSVAGSILFAILFLVSLGILIALRVMRPDDRWYNGRAVAESVKTRAWRWMMRAAPYEQDGNPAASSKQFINDLKAILNQNRSLAGKLPTDEYMKAPISDTMNAVRSRSLDDRLAIYKSDRVRDQADWYSRKAIFNKRRSRQWFWISVSLHAAAICMLLLRINNPSLPLPGAVIATAASAVLTWIQAKKHNELASSYSLAAHEIVLIQGEVFLVSNEKELSNFVVNTEAAFSREHTQWVARKNE